MAISIVMPRLGDFMTEGIVTAWAKSPGDEVKQGDVLVELDRKELEARLAASEARLLSDEAALKASEARLAADRANLVGIKSNLDKALADFVESWTASGNPRGSMGV